MKYLNSEYKPIREVLLYKPGAEISEIEDVASVFYNHAIDFWVMDAEFDNLIKVYQQFKINVHLIDSSEIIDKRKKCLFNMMYTRDLLFMTPFGAIISRMRHDVRRDEVNYAEKALLNLGISIIHKINGDGTMEGADVLWLNEKLVLVGVGNRTNMSGFRQVGEKLKGMGVECIPVPVPQEIQHLLGILQFVDDNLALVREELVDQEIIQLLKKNKIHLVYVPEIEEVKHCQAMNIVTIAPRQVIMPDSCPKIQRLYEKNNIKVVAMVKISQLINGAGGLACATSILSRDDIS